MKNRRLIESFNNAIEGIVSSIKSERNMKIHIGISIIVFFLCTYFKITKIEWIVIIITVFLVIFAEMINTSIENVCDAISNEYNNFIKRAKDIAAGAVLIVSINAVIVGGIIFGEKIVDLSSNLFNVMTASETSTILIIIGGVIFSTIILKVVIGNKSPMQGGMPSAHATISFSIATMIGYLSEKAIVVFLAYVLSMLVAQSRVEGKIHSAKEVVIGSILGVLITIVILKIYF